MHLNKDLELPVMHEALFLIDMAYIFKCVHFNIAFKARTSIFKLTYPEKSEQ